MQNFHVYALFWVAGMLLVVLSRRLLWFNRLSVRLRSFISPIIPFECLQLQTTKFFPQNELMNMMFGTAMVVSNTLALVLFPQTTVYEAVATRIGVLIIININLLFLHAFRHSILIESAAAYQPEFLWAHQALGFLTIMEMAIYAILVFRG